MFDDQQLCLTYYYIMSQFHSVFYSVENVSGFDWIPICILHDAWWSISRSKHFSSSQCGLQSAVSEANSYGPLFRIILFVSALKFTFCRMNSTSAIEMHSRCAVEHKLIFVFCFQFTPKCKLPCLQAFSHLCHAIGKALSHTVQVQSFEIWKRQQSKSSPKQHHSLPSLAPMRDMRKRLQVLAPMDAHQRK